MHEFDIRSRQYTGVQFKYGFEAGATNIGDFVLFDNKHGLVIERDGSQGVLTGFKKIYKITLGGNGEYVRKELAVDLMRLQDPTGISLPSGTGDVGLGNPFSFPFVTIEDVVVIDRNTIGVLNDNNYPFSVGRHLGTKQPDDNEFILIDLAQPLWRGEARDDDEDSRRH